MKLGVSASRQGAIFGAATAQTARWRCPETVVVLPVVDLNMPLTLALAWRRDNVSPLLANFIADVQRLPDVQAVNKG